ncbi:MAG: hypothetical protein RL385_890 [Pseudomonadota bacterium]|jgi:predicted DCC family thiol-disulfide oxidoreductase YuxK
MEEAQASWEIKVLYDGECPLCMREVRMLRRFNRRGKLALEDIADAGFDPARYGRSFEALMGQIHGVLPDGRLITGVEVFRRAYAAVGLGFILAPTAWAPLRPIFDRAYAWFAKNRLRLTGRPACDAGRCALPGR